MKFCYAGIMLALRRISYSLSVVLDSLLGRIFVPWLYLKWALNDLWEICPRSQVQILGIEDIVLLESFSTPRGNFFNYILPQKLGKLLSSVLLGQYWARNSTENSLFELVHEPALFMLSCIVRFFPPPFSFSSCCIETLRFGWQSHTVNLAPKLSLYDSVSLFLPCTIE